MWISEDELKVTYEEAVKILDNVISRRLIENKIINQIVGGVVSPSNVPREINNLMKNPLLAPLLNSNLINYEDTEFLNKLIPYSDGFTLNIN